MHLRFKCLILDHDDTAVASTADVHYPAHRETLRRLRPAHPGISLDDWILKNFHPGVMEYLTQELKFSPAELREEYRIWVEYCNRLNPGFFPGFLGALRTYKSRGGKVSVVSHSEKAVIERHYSAAFKESGVLPDLIFGWDHDPAKRKPAPWPVHETLSIFGISADDALIVDDLKPALLMGRASGVRVAAAGWGHCIPQIRAEMETGCDYYLESVHDFESLILGS